MHLHVKDEASSQIRPRIAQQIHRPAVPGLSGYPENLVFNIFVLIIMIMIMIMIIPTWRQYSTPSSVKSLPASGAKPEPCARPWNCQYTDDDHDDEDDDDDDDDYDDDDDT